MPPHRQVYDEPRGDTLAWVKSMGDSYHRNPGVGKRLPTFTTHKPDPALDGAIDIWATTTDAFEPSAAAQERSRGRRWWVYNGMRPASGTQILDAPAVDTRVAPWACWKHGIELWFYWHANHWYHNTTAYSDVNVWVDPITFPGNGGCNGDGLLVYPGRDTVFPAEDRGIAGPIASMRLKNIRRGVQDYEYLWLAQQRGLGSSARAIADTAVPAAFQPALDQPVSWSVRGSDWDTRRRRLADLIAVP